jgi:hypothetical protein
MPIKLWNPAAVLLSEFEKASPEVAPATPAIESAELPVAEVPAAESTAISGTVTPPLEG